MESLVRFSEINQTKIFEFHLTLSSKKVSQLVKRLDLLSIKKVSLQGKLSPLSLNEWILKAIKSNGKTKMRYHIQTCPNNSQRNSK